MLEATLSEEMVVAATKSVLCLLCCLIWNFVLVGEIAVKNCSSGGGCIVPSVNTCCAFYT